VSASAFDLLIRGGLVITPAEVYRQDIGIADGKIAALAPELDGAAKETIDAKGLHVFPGLIDSHVHFNEPGRANWEGFSTGSRALAAGGGTLFFDMPLNSHPPTLDPASFDLKLAAALATSLVDFAFWGGLVPGSVPHMEPLAERGVVGFKAFMADSGIEDFPRADDRTLRAGMKQAARLDKIVAVHAESEEMIRSKTNEFLSVQATTARDYLDSRPIPAELDAISRALEMAGETGCALHIVHVSCGVGITLIASARRQGVNVTCETCPHYLTLAEEDFLKIGAPAKCAPPLRAKPAQESLWEYLKSDQINTIGSDHSPSPPELKSDTNFFKVWGGISGIQHTLPLLLTEGRVRRNVALPLIARLTSVNVADRFKLPASKGRIAAGADADLALVDFNQTVEVRSSDLLYRHALTPYLGRALTGKPVRTILRGQTVCRDRRIVSKAMGKLVKAER
jgi:allantoinase